MEGIIALDHEHQDTRGKTCNKRV